MVQNTRVTYAPGRLCILFAADTEPDLPGYPNRYPDPHLALNLAIDQVLGGSGVPDDIGDVLREAQRRPGVGRPTPWLQPLPFAAPPDEVFPCAMVVYGGCADIITVGHFEAMHFYAIDRGLYGPAGVPLVDPLVAALTRLVNQFRAAIQSALPAAHWQLVGAAPVHLATALHTGYSPSARPEPAAPGGSGSGKWTFMFRAGQGGAAANSVLVQAAADLSSGVDSFDKTTVAVLDTSPHLPDVQTVSAAHPENALLANLLTVLQASSQEFVSRHPRFVNQFAPLGIVPYWSKRSPLRSGAPAGSPRWLVPDHGLFVAGIIRDIAPQVTKLHLVRVLDDTGVGDVQTIACAIRMLVQDVLASDDAAKLILNLSLGWEFDAELAPLDLGNGRPIDLVHRLICCAIDRYHARLLVVAAAGNDYDQTTVVRPAPDRPAAYREVLGVAALNRALAPAQYSNMADIIPPGPDALAIYGGDTAFNARKREWHVDPGDSIKGVFTCRRLPLRSPVQSNTSTWVSWTGSSFAAPIVTALAALVSPQMGSLTAGGIANRLQGAFPGGVTQVPDLNCVAINLAGASSAPIQVWV